MFDTNDPKVVWVAPLPTGHKGDGTAENPFGTIDLALEAVRPGYTLVLKKGVYDGSVNFELSGTIHEPIRIAAETDGEVVVTGGCWFFYDSSDCIVSGITWRDAPFGAVSVIGCCERNRFENLRFINCGTEGKTSCTLFFGGSGGNCSVVENCSFEHAAAKPGKVPTLDTMAVGLMVSEGDAQEGAPIKNHVFRRNRFVNYDYGILAGTNDSTAGLYGHIVEYNRVENSLVEGILVRCGDTQVRGNQVQGSRGNSIVIAAGRGSVVEDNRVVDCGSGIQVFDADHTIINNCVIRSGGQAVRVCGAVPGCGRKPAQNLFMENNTFVDCGDGAVAGVRIDPGTTCIINNNLVAGRGTAIEITDPAQYRKEHCLDAGDTPAAKWMAVGNGAGEGVALAEGFSCAEIIFDKRNNDDYTNATEFGACGWVLKPETFDPDLDTVSDAEKYCHFDPDDDDELPEDAEGEDGPGIDIDEFVGNLFNPEIEKKTEAAWDLIVISG